MITRRRAIELCATTLLAPAVFSQAAAAQTAQPWPTRAVRLVVPGAPGGGIDTIGRLLGAKLAERWKQDVIIDNRPGLGGNLASEFVARSEPDGYTLYITAAGLVLNQFMLAETAYNPATDFAPVTLVGLFPTLMVVPATSPFRSIPELVAHAKANPGKLTFGSTGYGSSAHVSGMLFKFLAGVDMIHVTYRDVTAALNDVVAGSTDVTFTAIASSMPLVKAGKLRALGVTSATRAPMASDVPTIAEAGLAGYDTSSWFAFVMPAKTPAEIVRKIHDDTIASIADPTIQRQFAALGVLPVASSSAQLAALLKAETARWRPVIARAGIKIDQ